MSETYYGRSYGFHSAPFHVTPESSSLFETTTHNAAFGAIEYGISAGKGFMVVTGEVGVGKTTILRTCLDQLDRTKSKIIYIYNPALTTLELYATLLEELDCEKEAGPQQPGNALRRLLRALLALHKSGVQVILAVDEAQNMPERTLESLRILSNLETRSAKLLQIVLVGQPELEAVLAKHSLRQLAQRVAVRARIKPLRFRQSFRYIEHRCRAAGRTAKRSLFTSLAALYIVATARGIPRILNMCCDNALINAYGHGAERVSLKIAWEACRLLNYPIPFRNTALATLVALACLATAVWTLPAYRHMDTAVITPSHVAVVAAPTVPAAAAASPVLPAAGSQAPSPTATLQQEAALSENVPAVPPGEVMVAAQDPSTAQGAAAPATPAAEARPDGATMGRWAVQPGDTIYKVCKLTYGVCDPAQMNSILAANPQLDARGTIKPGQMINLPVLTAAQAHLNEASTR